MAEDESESIFDVSMKKKKKKKKTGFDVGTLEDSATGVADGESETVPEASRDESELRDDKDEDSTLDLDDFSGQKKKKKKKKPFSLEDVDSALMEIEDEMVQIIKGEDEEKDESVALDEEIDFNLSKKKKKKKRINVNEPEPENFIPGDEDDEGDATFEEENKSGMSTSSSWHGSDRDYTYDELLLRVFNIMREKNPDMVAGEKRRFVMKPPQVLRVGTKKSSFANFLEICKMLHRQPKHLQAFLLAELGTSGSVDANNQLIIKGRFQQKQIENVLRRYIKEYVTCHTCRSPETILQKDTRLFFLQCETCGSRCSVASIKSGFQAVTSKRAAMRAKTA